jgi:hypothetical protein
MTIRSLRIAPIVFACAFPACRAAIPPAGQPQQRTILLWEARAPAFQLVAPAGYRIDASMRPDFTVHYLLPAASHDREEGWESTSATTRAFSCRNAATNRKCPPSRERSQGNALPGPAGRNLRAASSAKPLPRDSSRKRANSTRNAGRGFSRRALKEASRAEPRTGV